MPVYFIISTKIEQQQNRQAYDEYIKKVKPIVEHFGGKYILQSEEITALSNLWSPDRIIIIEFSAKKQIDEWLTSKEYKAIESLRLNSVVSSAIIAENKDEAASQNNWQIRKHHG